MINMKYNIEKYMHDEDLSYELGENPMMMDIIVRDHVHNISIYICPPYIDHEKYYFKIYNNIDPTLSTKQARISIISPEYIDCNDSYREKWILNNKEKDILISIIARIYDNDYDILFKNITVWECIKLRYIHDGYLSSSILYPDILTRANMPDYTKLKEE